jgi:hypothetical protein
MKVWRQFIDSSQRRTASECWIFDPVEFLRDVEPTCPGKPLEHTWAVTSDSIAARVAAVSEADELVLLKSADPPSDDRRVLCDAGYVDRAFPDLADGLPVVRYVNLRAMNEDAAGVMEPRSPERSAER